MPHNGKRDQLTDAVLDQIVLELPLVAAGMRPKRLAGHGMTEEHVRQVDRQLRGLLEHDESLRCQATTALTQPIRPDGQYQGELLRGLRERLATHLAADGELRRQLIAAFSATPAAREPGTGSSAPVRRRRALPAWLRRGSSRTLMYLRAVLMLLGFLLVLAGPSVVALAVHDEDLRWTLLRVFGVVILAGFPGFLLARFVFSRARTVWDEFVLNLHRLGLDEPRYLPEPLNTSTYYRTWYEDGGAALCWSDSIYERKFEAAYGAIPREGNPRAMLTFIKAMPAYLTTLVLAVLWTAVLWGAAPLTLPTDAMPTITALAFGFLGAYAFSVEMLVRRYFQLDLRPIAYSGILARLFLVLVAAFVIHHAFGDQWSAGTEAATLFIVGFFPTTALQLLRIALAGVLRKVRLPNLASDYPLNDLDGMNIWYETRLLEVGIEDMQNLASTNIVDVILNTRVPVARLVDWLDQAILYLHMAPVRGMITDKPIESDLTGQQRPSRPAIQARYVLRSHGIRAATDLDNERAKKVPGLSGLLGDDKGVSAVDAIWASLADEPNLAYVRNWKRTARSPSVSTTDTPAPPSPEPLPP